ncbi:phosphate ABC transporter ATP-binding protein [Rhizobium binxianense]
MHHEAQHAIKMKVEDVSFWYDGERALKNVSLDIFENEVTALIGPSGCGKSTLLRCLNRTNEIIPGTRMEGRVLLDGLDINASEIDPPLLRQRFGWIAQRPDPLPWSIRTNILYGPSLRGLCDTAAAEKDIVEQTLHAVGLWDEVKDRLSAPATDLSIGQQQRLCIARAIASHSEVLLMDEPCSALDPVASALIESLIDGLRKSYTIVIVTHNLQQAARIANRTAFFFKGVLTEEGDTEQIILAPRTEMCRDFVTGRFG